MKKNLLNEDYHKFHKNRLAQIKNYKLIYFDKYFQEHFIKRYMYDLPRASFELFGTELTYQQIDIWEEFLKSGGWQGGRLAVPSGHGSGKTKMIGLISSLHLLTFYKSITRIQAPTLTQITTSSFKEISESLNSLKANRKIRDKFYNSGWGFLLDLIQINKTKIYIKGFDTSWYIEARTAPKGDSTNLSGQHQLNYLLIFDEASGIPDEHIEASLGALSEEFNSCIMFSQHTKLSGKFHEFVTTKSINNGGVWNVLRLSSRYSPRVSEKQLKLWLETYSEDEIRVRIDGLPPKKDNGMLLSPDEIMRAYRISDNPYKDTIFKSMKQIVFSYDIGYTGYRDSSVLVIAEVEKIIDKRTDKEKTFIKVINIQKYNGTNGKLPTDFVKDVVFKEILQFLDEKANQNKFYDVVYVCGDATAGGYEAFTILEDLLLEVDSYNFETKAIQWGSEKLYYEDKKRFANGRAKAFVKMREAITSDRLVIATQSYKTALQQELSNIPFNFTSTFKYKILSKEEMKKKGIHSPDIADTIAQMYLLNIFPSETNYNIKNNNSHNKTNSELSNQGNELNEDELIELDVDINEIEFNDKDEVIENDKNSNIESLLPKTLNLDDEFE